jgi:hypothetical protein
MTHFRDNVDCTAFGQWDDGTMTLIDYLILTRDVSAAITKLKAAIASGESSSDEVELFATRLKKACEALSKAVCRGTSSQDLREAARLVVEGNRLVFAVKIVGTGEEFPRLHRDAAA